MRSERLARTALALLALVCAWQLRGLALQGGVQTVSGSVVVTGQSAGFSDKSDVVVWLSPARDTPRPRATPGRRFRIIQQGKRFQPHVLVVQVGSFVDFPNLDPIFHNVFSLFDGKRFDLGLYEAGTTRGVSFTRAGICYVFCNIHPDMSAVVVVVDSPYFATSTAAGTFSIPEVPTGRYKLSVWHERFRPEDAAEFPKDVTVASSGVSVGALRFVEASRVPTPHKNKFGHDYPPPGGTNPLYP